MFLALLAISGTTVGIILNTPGLFFVSASQELGIGRGEFSSYVTILKIALIVALVYAGGILQKHRLKIRTILTTAALLEVAAYLIFWQGTALWHWYVGGVLLGIGMAFNSNMLVAVLTNNWFKIKTQRISVFSYQLPVLFQRSYLPLLALLFRITALEPGICLLPS